MHPGKSEPASACIRAFVRLCITCRPLRPSVHYLSSTPFEG
jgi:hypothetical protein